MTTRGSTLNKFVSAFMALLLAVAFIPTAPKAAYAESGAGRLVSQDAPALTITPSEITTETTSITVSIEGLPEGGMLSVKSFSSDEAIAYDKGSVMRFIASPASSNEITFESTLAAGTRVAAFIVVSGECVAQSETLTVAAPQISSPEVSITSDELKVGDASVAFTVSNLPSGAMAVVKLYDAATSSYTFSDGTTLKIMNASTGAPVEGENTATFASDDLAEGKKVVILIMTGYNDGDIVAASDPVTVRSAGGTTEPTTPTRSEIIAACSVSMANPDGGTSFKLSDTTANITVNLHESIDFARLTVYAYPKAASFDPDNSSLNKSVFSKTVSTNAATELKNVTATFDLSELDTTYNLVAYVYYLIPEQYSSEYDYQYVTSSPFPLTDDGGQTTESYTYPRASIVEDTLTAGSTALHVNLSGDERLFKLVDDTKGNASVSDRFTIHFLVVEYDADITSFSLDEDSYTKLYDEEATAAFADKEVELEQALTEGKRVRALCYWTQYTGDAAPLPVPKSNDYEGNKYGDNSVVVTSGTPIAGSPAVTVSSPITTATTSFNVNVKNLPDGAIMFVEAFGPDETIAHSYDKALGTFTGYGDYPAVASGANSVNVESGKLSAGDRIVAFLMVSGETVAQSEPVTVTEPVQVGDGISIVGDSVSSDAQGVTVNLDDDPNGAAVLVKFFAASDEVAYDKGTSLGYFENVVKGENALAFTMNTDRMTSGGKLVAFLVKDGSAAAQSEAVPVTYVAKAPTCTISPNDSMFTAGDMFVRYTYTVDPNARNVTYKLYQFAGDELNKETAEVLASGTLTTSQYNYSGGSYFGVGGHLAAGSKVQLVVTADGVDGVSNVLSVGETPAWAKVTPTIAFDQAYVTDDATAVKVLVNYPEGYKELGDEFFCNVTVYLYPGTYTDEEFEDQELDEKPSIAPVIAGMNSKNGETNGSLTLQLSENHKLTVGDRLMAKVRLPRAEQSADDDSEADYLSMSIPIVSADASIPGESLFVYNLSADTAKGAKLREVAEALGLPVTDLTQADLVRQVGAVVGYEGYDETDPEYADDNPTVEYLLMANLSEASLDRLLAAMSDAGITIGAKGITTDTNKNWPLGKLIVDIAEEHETVTALVNLQQLVKKAEALDQETYGDATDWEAMQDAMASAKALYSNEDEEPTAGELQAAYDALEPLYLSVSGQKKLDGAVVIAVEEQPDGTYTLTASVSGSTVEGLAYAYTWNDASQSEGAVLSGVEAGKVGERIVTVTATDADGKAAIGKLTAQLLPPDAPKGIVTSTNQDRVSLSWNVPAAGANQPAATGYLVELVDSDGAIVASKRVETAKAEFSALKNGTYTVKVAAVNVAGQGDKALAGVTVDMRKVTDSDMSTGVVAEGSQAYVVPAALAEKGGVSVELSVTDETSDNSPEIKRIIEECKPAKSDYFRVLDVSLVVENADGEVVGSVTDDFGTLYISFTVGKEFAGRTATVTQYHAGEALAPKDAVVSSEGTVRIGVMQLSSFAIAIAAADGGAGDDSGKEGPGEKEPATKSALTMHRLYNPNSGEHFYTSDEAEYGDVVAAGWDDEGIGWYAPESSKTPVYRLYNPNAGEHHYTTSANELAFLVRAGWSYEGIGWFSDDAKGVALQRVYNPNEYANNHHYTTDGAEAAALVELGWRDEGVAWYGLAVTAS